MEAKRLQMTRECFVFSPELFLPVSLSVMFVLSPSHAISVAVGTFDFIM